ncbi:hypothetical protein HK096_002178 [Nowakowskiella sp. JEL0078]|nr:hypothetical protein HK096_002178 [Nowakowskiella sp. JEL0078]
MDRGEHKKAVLQAWLHTEQLEAKFNNNNNLFSSPKRSAQQPADATDKPSLWDPSKINEQTTFANLGKKRAIVSKTNRKPVPKASLGDDIDEVEKREKEIESEDPYSKVDVGGYLKFLTIIIF